MGRAVRLFGFTALLISCSSGRPTVGAAPVELGASERCDSVTDTLPPDKSLEGLEGRYRLTLVKTEPPQGHDARCGFACHTIVRRETTSSRITGAAEREEDRHDGHPPAVVAPPGVELIAPAAAALGSRTPDAVPQIMRHLKADLRHPMRQSVRID